MLVILTGVAVATATAQSTLSGPAGTVISPEGLNLRSAPSTAGSVLQIVPFDSVVTITGAATSDSWYPVAYHGLAGWVSGQYLAAGALDALTARTAVSLVPPSVRTAVLPTPGAGGGFTTGAPVVLNAAAVPQITNLSAVPGATYQETVSYYGIDDVTVAGSMMGCGQPFDPYFTHGAATNDFPCGTRLLVIGPDGRQVDVTVMDHGGYTAHWMDLTYATFGMIADHKQGAIQATLKMLP
jgi:Bacterial SH3 domain